jgi:ABC-type multidrug transport system ATPase subunit
MIVKCHFIIGGSGSGKTSLLSVFSLRLDQRHINLEGDIRLNGHEYTRRELKAMSAYVMQDDVLHAEFTVLM